MLGLAQLRVFDAITRTGSFTKAAERLAVTPPAVSLQIRQLERQYGVPLFERIGRQVRLTPAGDALKQYTQRIFALAEDAERMLQGTRGFTATRLRIAATPTTAGYYLGPFWKALRQRYPGLRLELSVHNSRGVRERLLELHDDLGMLGGEADHPDLVLESFARDPLVVIVAPDHPWAKRHSVNIEDLRDQSLVLREPGSSTRELVERRLQSGGVAVGMSVEIASTEAIKRAIEAGTGVSVLASAAVRRDVATGHLHALRIRDRTFALTLSLACHRERRESPLIRAVLDATLPVLRRRGGRVRPSPSSGV
jgi:LysR family transcriptional regulator, low CO2-responsive transcriptional regulator